MSLKVKIFEIGMGGAPSPTHSFLAFCLPLWEAPVACKSFTLKTNKQQSFAIPYRGQTLYFPDQYNLDGSGEYSMTFYEPASRGVSYSIERQMLRQSAFGSMFDMWVIPFYMNIPSVKIYTMIDSFIETYQMSPFDQSTATNHCEITVNFKCNAVNLLSTPADEHIVRSLILWGLHQGPELPNNFPKSKIDPAIANKIKANAIM